MQRVIAVNTQDTLTELLVTKYGVDRSRLTLEASLADLGLDSLSQAELIFDIEDAFKITLAEEGGDLRTVADAIILIDAARTAGSTPAS